MRTCITNLCVHKKSLMFHKEHKEGLDNTNRALSLAKEVGGLSLSRDLSRPVPSNSAELVALAMKGSCPHQSTPAPWRQPSPWHSRLPKCPEGTSWSTGWFWGSCLQVNGPGDTHVWVGQEVSQKNAVNPVLKVTAWQKSEAAEVLGLTH